MHFLDSFNLRTDVSEFTRITMGAHKHFSQEDSTKRMCCSRGCWDFSNKFKLKLAKTSALLERHYNILGGGTDPTALTRMGTHGQKYITVGD